jgi:hypothetical protein
MRETCCLIAATLISAALLCGCRDQLPIAPAHGAYGQITNAPPVAIKRARPDISPAAPWTNGKLSVIQTELSPATLFHSRARSLSFFAGMAESGLSGPSFAAISTQKGPKIFRPGETIDPARLRESWFVVWWAGATNWTNWDSPWLVTLQHRPETIRFDTNGLHFGFASEAGYAAALPLYGYGKPMLDPTQSHPFTLLKDKKKRVHTWEWEKALPADPLARARYWASALREFPLYAEDSFSVDRAHDTVTFRQRIRWLSWNDDWETKHLKLAPVSPVLALAAREGFPAKFSKEPFDMEMPTPFGPYYGIEGVDEYTVTLPLLRYVNETEAVPALTNKSGIKAGALEQLRGAAAARLSSAKQLSLDEAASVARALPFLDEAARGTATATLKERFHREVPVTDMAVNGTNDPLESLWAYAHFTGDVEFVRERWRLVEKLFTIPEQTRWAAFASTGAGLRSGAALAFARLAYLAGDLDAYHYGAAVFARELAQDWVKLRAARYFRNHQPWHSLEAMPEEVFASEIRGDTGWVIDGPNFPANANERRFNNRWTRFANPDLARFYRDGLRAEVQREVDVTQKDSGSPEEIIANSMAVLRANEPMQYGRLIPAALPSPFVAGVERDVAGPHSVLVQTIRAPDEWPRLTWPEWKTPTGAPWNFGEVVAGTNAAPQTTEVPLNWNTRVLLLE